MEGLNFANIRKLVTRKNLQTGEYIPFSIRFKTCNLKEKTGGETIEIEHAIFFSQSNSIIRVQVCRKDELTRKIVPTKNIRAIHLVLIIRINNTEVQWS